MNIKTLLVELDNCKDSTSPKARSIRRQLRAAGHFVSGKKNAIKKDKDKKKSNKKEAKKKHRKADNEDEL